jgi:hypothetical protein
MLVVCISNINQKHNLNILNYIAVQEPLSKPFSNNWIAIKHYFSAYLFTDYGRRDKTSY